MQPHSRTPKNSVDALATKARYFGVGLSCGLVDPHEVAEWATRSFQARPFPPHWLAEIAFASRLAPLDLFTQLHEVAEQGGADSLDEEDVRDLLGRLCDAIDSDRLSPWALDAVLSSVRDRAPATSPLRRHAAHEQSRFWLRWQRQGDLGNAKAKLRTWLESMRWSALDGTEPEARAA